MHLLEIVRMYVVNIICEEDIKMLNSWESQQMLKETINVGCTQAEGSSLWIFSPPHQPHLLRGQNKFHKIMQLFLKIP